MTIPDPKGSFVRVFFLFKKVFDSLVRVSARAALLVAVVLSAMAEDGTEMTIDEWIALSDQERGRIAREWSPYDTSGIDQLLNDIANEFRKKHPRLNFQGLGNVHGSLELVVKHPFIFDNRLIPSSFLGLPVRASLSEPLPDDFEVFSGYVWAPENYANFVDNHVDEIRRTLGNPEMSRDEMLNALIGMPFEEWVEQCRKFGPGHTNL